MRYHLTDLYLSGCGPFKGKQHFTFKPLTLFSGPNESGKTTVLEGIIRALFMKSKNDPVCRVRAGETFRNMTAEVKLADQNSSPLSFKSGKRETLLTRLSSSNPQSINLRDLLYVRAGQSRILSSEQGVSTAFINNIYSGRIKYNRIRENIITRLGKSYNKNFDLQQETLLSSNVTKGTPGELRSYNKELNNIRSILQDLDQSSFSRLMELQQQKEKLEQQLQQNETHKKYLACLWHREIAHKEEQLKLYHDDIIKKCNDNLVAVRTLNNELKNKPALEKKYNKTLTEETWLKHAVEQVKNRDKTVADRPKINIFFLTGMLMLVTAGILSFFSLNSAAVFFSIAAAAGLLTGYRHQQKINLTAGEQKEIRDILSRAASRTQTQINNQIDLQSVYDHYKTEVIKLEAELDNLHKQNKQLEQLKYTIKFDLQQLPGADQAVCNNFTGIQSFLSTCTKERKQLEADINKLQTEQAGLNVDEKDYIRQKPVAFTDTMDSKFLNKQAAALRQDLERISTELEENNHILQRIKERMKDSLDEEDVSAEHIGFLLSRLKAKYNTVYNKRKTTAASVYAGIILSNILDELNREDMYAVQDNLNSASFRQMLAQFTEGNYNELFIDNESLAACSADGTFELKDLSSGTLDQIMLALRLEMILNINNKQPLFLLLDDAFQHADYNRRQILVEQSLKLVKDKWQIIYFTMDNHLADLFKEQAASLPDKKFIWHQL
ncbi:MAG TPA: AAA family ATPase [Spirochaetota bacterium]|nr:AAA family ATPase [Spirochaetota bacterium]